MESAILVKLVVALIWGVIVGLLAKRKNRNAWGWGLAGALSWIIALLILAFMPYRCPKCNRSLTNQQGKDKACPACNVASVPVAPNPSQPKFASDTPDQHAMATYGITIQNGKYVFQTYRYDRLIDAVNYARLKSDARQQA